MSSRENGPAGTQKISIVPDQEHPLSGVSSLGLHDSRIRHHKRAHRKHVKRMLRKETAELNNIIIRPSIINQLHLLVTFLFSLWLTFDSIARFPSTVEQFYLGNAFSFDVVLSLPLFGILPLVLGAALIHKLFNRKYVLCEDYILEIEGLIAFTLRTVRLRYLHIRGLEIDCNIIQRVLGVGDLRVGGEISPEDTDVVMMGIYNPNRYKDIIKERINRKLDLLSRMAVRQHALG